MLIQRPLFLVSAPCAGTSPIFELLSRARRVGTLKSAARNELRTRLESGGITAGEIRALVRDGLPDQVRWLSAIVANAKQIPLLNEAFPDGLFIYVHRDAKEQLARMRLDGHSENEWSETTSRILRDLSELPPRRWCAIDIDGFLSNRPHEAALLGRFAGLSWRVRPGPAARAGRRPFATNAVPAVPDLAHEAAIFSRANHPSLRERPEKSFWRSLPEKMAKAVVSSRLAAGLTVGAVSVPVAASAATLTVTNNSDTGVSGDGSLRGEIAAAQPGDTITFDPSLNGETITLTNGFLKITESLTIQGPGSSELTLDGDTVFTDAGFSGGSGIFYLYATNPGVDGGAKTPADITISGLTLQHGDGMGGGALMSRDTNLTLSDVTFRDNVAVSGGALGKGGDGTLTLQNSTITGNTALGGGGGLSISNTPEPVLLDHVQVTGNTAENGSSGGGISASRASGGITIQDSTISDNTSGGNGGGLYLTNSGSATVQGSTVSGNVARNGGGLMFYGAGNVLVEDTTVSGNASANSGAGILVSRVSGGAVVNSTVTGNTVMVPDGGGIAAPGGGVVLHYSPSIAIRETTIAGNSAGSAGGLFMFSGQIVVVDSIIAGNLTPANPDAGVSANIDVGQMTGTFATSWSLIQNPGVASFADSDGGVGDAGQVLGEGNIVGEDPLLGALADNGGTTGTMLPGAGSPVINAGDPNFPSDWPAELTDAGINAPTTDQRGDTRVLGGRIDMGAVEVQATPDAGSTVQTSDAGTTRTTTDTGKGCNCNSGSDATLALLTPIGLRRRRRRNPSRMCAR